MNVFVSKLQKWAAMCFCDYSQIHVDHICLAVTFIVSHLVCCNIGRTVGSLWRSCVISRRVTHLEAGYRADKPLLCLGHLEDQSCSLLWAHRSRINPVQGGKKRLTRSWMFHTLTYSKAIDSRILSSAADMGSRSASALGCLERIHNIWKAAPQGDFRGATRCYLPLRKTSLQRPTQGNSVSFYEWQLLFFLRSWFNPDEVRNILRKELQRQKPVKLKIKDRKFKEKVMLAYVNHTQCCPRR